MSDTKYDFILPQNDYEATVEKLKNTYGIKIEPKRLKTNLVKIEEKNKKEY